MKELDKIYDAIANKELKMWCKVMYSKTWYTLENEKDLERYNWWIWYYLYGFDNGVLCLFRDEEIVCISKLENDYKIIGNPIMIWDIISWLDQKNFPAFYYDELYKLRTKKSDPIEEQPNKLSLFIHDLLQDD